MRSHMSIVFAVFLGSMATNTARAQSLIDIYQKAVARDARFASSVGAYRAGIEKLPQGRAQLLPSLAVNAEKGRHDSEIEYIGSTSFEGGTRVYEERKYSVTLTQPLYRLQNIAAYRQSKAQFAMAEAQMAAAKQDLVLRTTQAYFELLAAQQNLATASARVASTKGQYDQNKAKLSVGAAARLEVSEAKARADVARSQELATRHELVNKRQALARIIGENPDVLDELAPNFVLQPPTPDNLEPWIAHSEANNPQLQSMRHNVAAAEHEVRRVRAGHHPSIDLVGEYASAYATGSVYTAAQSDTAITSARLRLEMPLYQGGQVSSRVREALGGLEKARADLEDARRDVIAQTTQHFNGTVSAMDQVLALEQALSSSEEAARANRVGHELGTRNFVDVLNAEQQVYDVKRDLTKARHDYILSLLRLKAAAGQLQEDEVLTLNSYLRPVIE